MKISKGENGYIEYNKKLNLMVSIVFLIAVMVLYIIGKAFLKNFTIYFLISSALMILPAAQYLSKYFLFARYKSGVKNYYDKFKAVHDQLIVLSDLIVVKGKKTIYFDFVINTDSIILACHKPKNIEKANKEEILNKAKSLLQSIYHPKGYDLPIIVLDNEEALLTYIIQNVKGTMNNIDENIQDDLANVILQNAI